MNLLRGQRGTERSGPLSGVALTILLLAQLMTVVDFSIVNVAIPDISRELLASSTSTEWVVTAYAITFGGFLVLGGRAADLFGRRRLLVWGLVGFAVASAAGGVATDLSLLVIARALQGVAAAAVVPAVLSTLTTSFPEGPARTRVLAYYGTVSSVGLIIGLVLGGVLVGSVGWRGVFFVNLPIGLILAAVCTRIVPSGAPSGTRPRLDVLSSCLVTAGVATFVYAPTAGVDHGWTSDVFFGTLVVAGVLLSAFVLHDRRSRQPVMPLSIFRSRTLAAGNGVMLLAGAWNAAEVLLVSLFCQDVLHYSALQTGLIVVPQGVAGVIRGLVGAQIVHRLGLKRFLAMSAAISAVGLGLLLRFPVTSHYPWLAVVLFIVGFGTTSTVFGATVAGTAGVDNDEQGLASALVNTARQVGSAIGVATLLAVAEVETGSRTGVRALADGYRLAMGVCAALAVAVCLLALLLVRDPRPRDEPSEPRKLATARS